MKIFITTLLITLPLILFGQHTITLHTGYGHRLKFDQQVGDVMTSPRSFSLGTSYSFTKKVCDVSIEVGVDFMIFGYAYEYLDENSFGAPTVLSSTEFGYLSFSSISNVVLGGKSFLPRWSLAIGPGFAFSPTIEGDVQYYQIDVNNRQPPQPENLYLTMNLDNEEVPFSLLVRAALRYDASKRLQIRLGIEHFLTDMANGDYRFHNRAQGSGQVKVRPNFLRVAMAFKL